MQASEFLDGSAHQRPHLVGIGDIRRLEHSVGAKVRDKSRTPVGVDIGDHDPSALGHKPLHEAATDARRPAGHDGNLAVQFINHTTS